MDKIWITVIIIGIILLITLVLTIVSITEISKIYGIASTNKSVSDIISAIADYNSPEKYLFLQDTPVQLVSVGLTKPGKWLLSGYIVYGGKNGESSFDDGHYLHCFYSVDKTVLKPEVYGYGLGGSILRDNWGTITLPVYLYTSTKQNEKISISAKNGKGENTILYAYMTATYLPQ